MSKKLKIREGGYYRNGYGDVRGPIMPTGYDEYPWRYCDDTYRHDGTWHLAETEQDLISEVYVSDTPPAEWQPIETAPKDGTRVLGFDPGQWEEEQVSTTYFVGNHGWSQECKITCTAWDQYSHEIWEPTHWMPLPSPPEGGEA